MPDNHTPSRRVRTRVAPSPTGDPHVGTAYVALINYCFAKQNGGDFLLRIEDTDRARSTPESERAILEALNWSGLRWDEGPDVGGPHGPYRQSERTAIYREHTDRLVADGNAFLCFCTPERLEEMRTAQRAAGRPQAYDGLCLTLSAAQIEASLRAGIPHVVRMKVPREGVAVVHDLIRGDVEFAWDSVDMQVLLKSDGMPTYHLANVVDDHLMEITHVMRGEEWLSSAPKHILLYRYFGWEMPQLAHLPLLRNPDRSKLSKRKNPTGILFYRRMGYLPETVLNFLGLLAMSAGEGDEVMDLTTMVERFRLEHVALGGPVFDVAKLDWLSGRYLREKLDPTQFARRFQTWTYDETQLAQIASLAQSRVERLSDVVPLTGFLFAGAIPVELDRLRSTKFDDEMLRKLLALMNAELDTLATWKHDAISAAVKATSERLEIKVRDTVRPLYVAITGSPTSLPLFDAMELLGRDLCRERLRRTLTALGGVSEKQLKAWQNT